MKTIGRESPFALKYPTGHFIRPQFLRTPNFHNTVHRLCDHDVHGDARTGQVSKYSGQSYGVNTPWTS